MFKRGNNTEKKNPENTAFSIDLELSRSPPDLRTQCCEDK